MTAPAKLVIQNIGLILSGKIEQPILDGDCIIALDGKISEVGYAKDLDLDNADTLVDAHGTCVSPGLIDSHVHPVIGDYTPRQQQLNWIDSTLHGGVTCMISAGEVHAPGRPKDVVGLKAMAIAAQRWYENFRPSGVKLLGEVGLGTVKAGETAKEMVAWARKYGIQSTIHTGGPSIPGSGLIDKDVVLEADADIIGHINGGHTALPDSQITCLCESCLRGIEIVHNGNERAGLLAMRTAFELKQPERIILGTDGPAGSGAQPLGILRMIAMLSSLGDVPAEIAWCFATGNTARMRDLDCGTIENGKSADMIIVDRAQHAPGKDMLDSIRQGNLPGVGMTIIDGIVRSQRSRNTPPAETLPELVKAPPAAGGGGH
jgi:enamidase